MTMTITGDALTDYQAHLTARKLRPATIRAYTGWPRRLQDDTRPLLDHTTDSLEDWICCQRWAPATHCKAVQALKAFYSWATLTGRIEVDPAAPLRPARVPRPVPEPCPEATWRTAVDHASGDTYWRLRLAADTGARRCELAAVHSSDVRQLPSGPALHVTGKGGKARLIPLPDDLAQWVSLQHGFIFPTADGRTHRSPDSVGRWYARNLGIHGHTLRHRYATRVYASTHDIEAVRDLLGHASVETTQGYVQVGGDVLASAARAGWDHAA